MWLILLLLGIVLPRIVILILWLLTTWFNGVFDGPMVPVLGFLFLPSTLLWYSVVMNTRSGQWGVLESAILLLALFVDISGFLRRRSR